MRANPGGGIGPDEAIGRDSLIESIWKTLDVQSVVLVAERRIGKTTINKKMVAEPLPNQVAIYRDVEGAKTAAEFVELVHQDALKYAKNSQKLARLMTAIRERFGGLEIAGLFKLPDAAKPHWKQLLEQCIAAVADLPDTRTVFFWDELPLMLLNVAKQDGGPAVAMEILDTLRFIRQTHESVRMVFTGSIGLHHVEDKLKQQGHANDATNDMRTIEIPPLDLPVAMELVARLIEGEGIHDGGGADAAEALVRAVDCVPYFIHHVIATLATNHESLTTEAIRRVVDEAVVAANDPWHLQHYEHRLRGYYGAQMAMVAASLLDAVASSNERVHLAELRNAMQSDGQLHQSLGNEAGVLKDDSRFRWIVKCTRSGSLPSAGFGGRDLSVQVSPNQKMVDTTSRPNRCLKSSSPASPPV